MSGVLHSIGKVFGKVWDFVKPIVKWVVIAAAIYFTAGVAMSYFAGTAAFAASMPGFAAGGTLGLGVGEGAVAGTGVFSTVAANIGLGSGLAGGALEAGTSVSALASAGYTAGEIGIGANAATAAGTAVAFPAAGAGAVDATGASVAAAGAGGAGAGTGAIAAKAGMSLTDKLLLASVGTQTIGGLTAPSPRDIQSAKNGYYGAFYGTNSDGSGSPAPDLSVNPKSANPGAGTGTVAPQVQIPGVNIPGQDTTAPPTGKPGEANAQTTQQSAQAQQLIPNVSYSGQPLPGSTPDFAVQGATPLSKPKLIPASA